MTIKCTGESWNSELAFKFLGPKAKPTLWGLPVSSPEKEGVWEPSRIPQTFSDALCDIENKLLKTQISALKNFHSFIISAVKKGIKRWKTIRLQQITKNSSSISTGYSYIVIPDVAYRLRYFILQKCYTFYYAHISLSTYFILALLVFTLTLSIFLTQIIQRVSRNLVFMLTYNLAV